MMKKLAVFSLIAVCIWLFATDAFTQDAQKAMIDNGRQEFLTRRCWFCHDVEVDKAALQKNLEQMAEEEGDELKGVFQKDKEKIGGDLSGVGAKYSKESLKDLLQNPKKHFKNLNKEQKRAVQRMCRVCYTRSDKGLEEIIAYLMSLDKADEADEKENGSSE
ncbi:MAG TPA: c-type cytochrome [Thermodesulfobacteriota bacterium]|nr:c-type cytochrome [Thermodesulfobacteriota bacterium]